jgi:hypothetical protein
MNTREITGTLTTLLAELVDGPPAGGEAYVLNPGDAGLLRSLERLSAAEASASANGGATIAAHVAHLGFGLGLMNRWATEGGNPFAGADWTAAWRTTAVGDAEWSRLRASLADETHRWLDALRTPREVREIELNGAVGSIAHLAYHRGAIRQIARATRGPRAEE